MSFNPVLARLGRDEADLMPLPAPGECLVLKRQGIHLDMKVASRSYSGKGYLYLTTRRCVFIKDGKITAHKNWSSLEFPLRSMYGPEGSGHPPEFHQPVFGANYMSGVTPPVEGVQFPFEGAGVWKWSFKEGGCAQFVKTFYALHKAVNRGGEAAADLTAQRIIGQGGAAYMDPTDPSIIFVQQPQPQQPYSYNPQQQSYMPMPQQQNQCQAMPQPQNQYPIENANFGPPYGGPSPAYGRPPPQYPPAYQPAYNLPPPAYAHQQPQFAYAPAPGQYASGEVGFAPPQYRLPYPGPAVYPPHPGPFGHPLYPSAHPVSLQTPEAPMPQPGPLSAAQRIPTPESPRDITAGRDFVPAPLDSDTTTVRPARTWMEPRAAPEPERPEPHIPDSVRQAVEEIESRMQEKENEGRRR